MYQNCVNDAINSRSNLEMPVTIQIRIFVFLLTVSKHKGQKIHNYNIASFVQV